jgi:hypothetical protein
VPSARRGGRWAQRTWTCKEANASPRTSSYGEQPLPAGRSKAIAQSLPQRRRGAARTHRGAGGRDQLVWAEFSVMGTRIHSAARANPSVRWTTFLEEGLGASMELSSPPCGPVCSEHRTAPRRRARSGSG